MKYIDRPYKNLRATMTVAGLDTAGLAEKLSMSYTTLTFKLRKKTPWTIDDMQAVQKVVNEATGNEYTLDYLFTE